VSPLPDTPLSLASVGSYGVVILILDDISARDRGGGFEIERSPNCHDRQEGRCQPDPTHFCWYPGPTIQGGKKKVRGNERTGDRLDVPGRAVLRASGLHTLDSKDCRAVSEREGRRTRGASRLVPGHAYIRIPPRRRMCVLHSLAVGMEPPGGRGTCDLGRARTRSRSNLSSRHELGHPIGQEGPSEQRGGCAGQRGLALPLTREGR
jgi:hypothetical protein